MRFVTSPDIVILKGDDMYQFLCPECESDFECANKKRKFCSEKCLYESRKLKEKTPTTKCPTCDLEKDRKNFWVNNSKPNGLHYQCIQCAKSKYVDKTTPEFLEKERKRSLKKMRLIRGIDPEFKGNYKTGPKANPETHWNNKGYRYILRKGHPNAQRTGKMFQHVWIMSEYLGRPLLKTETVHHKNGLRYDNRIENLELWSHNHPYGQRVEDKLEWCKQFASQYGYKLVKE